MKKKVPDAQRQYITVDKPPEKAEKFRQQRKAPYFKAQVNANIYLVNNIGHLLLAGEPERVGDELRIPVYHSTFGSEEPIGFLSADAHTLKVYEHPQLLRKLRQVINELHPEDASPARR